jgi:polysaccharide deacetylase family protein (PEP-CTERM system associated)
VPDHAFTVDLEEWFHGIELAVEDWPRETRLAVGLDRLRGLLDKHGTKATFFVLGAVAERHPTLISELAADGHEIACHGYGHEFIYKQSPAEFRDDLRKAKDAIVASGGPVPRGYRAPYFSIRTDSLWALEILSEEGFTYDSSIFPVTNYRYGISDAPTTPHVVSTSAGPIREIPLTPLRLAGRNVPFSGGAYLRILPWWTQRLAWKAAAGKGRPLISYVHPWELDPDHPRVSLPRRVSATHYARLGVTERRLDKLLSLYAFGRMDDVFAEI